MKLRNHEIREQNTKRDSQKMISQKEEEFISGFE